MECSDGTRIQGRMVLDATGHARKLVEYDKPFDPGYQVPNPSQFHSSICSYCRVEMPLSVSSWVCLTRH